MTEEGLTIMARGYKGEASTDDSAKNVELSALSFGLYSTTITAGFMNMCCLQGISSQQGS